MNAEPPLRLLARKSNAHKGDYGRALLIGGSRGMAGSIAMSSIAALRTGSGLVTAAVPDRCLESVAAFHSCVMTQAMPDDGSGHFSLDAAAAVAATATFASAIGCGPGMTTEPGSIRIVQRLLHATSVPRVLDADAINALTTIDWISGEPLGPLVLTPHPGELQRLTGASSRDHDAQVEAAGSLAVQTGLVMVVKGGPTSVVSEGSVWTNTTGNPGMATAGSGDVLTGVIASLLGQQLTPWDAARLGVWIHGLAGDLAAERYGQAGMTAAEILEMLPRAVAAAVEA